jgi:hypothetical protein
MNAGRTARWTTRFIALAMIVVALVAFRIMESQLRRIGKAAEGVESRAETRAQKPAPAPVRQPITARLPMPGLQPGEGEEDVDSKQVTPDEDPARAAREEALPQPGRIPEGAVW